MRNSLLDPKHMCFYVLQWSSPMKKFKCKHGYIVYGNKEIKFIKLRIANQFERIKPYLITEAISTLRC